MTKQEEVIETLQELQRYLDDRIVDLHKVKGLQQARHAYIFYRSFVYEAIDQVRNLPVKKK